MKTPISFAWPVAMTMASMLAGPTHAQQAQRLDTTDRLIVRLADWADPAPAQPMAEARARALSATARTHLRPKRRMSGGAHVMQLTHAMPRDEVRRIATRLMSDGAVLHAEPDMRKFPLAQAQDPLYGLQWALREAAGGINAERAWDVTTGVSSVVVAMLDTGIRPGNPDFAGRLAAGWDFVREDALGLFATANDGDGRDADASDPGDWVSAGEAGQPPFEACPQQQDSSWHGTLVAGIVAASANNGYGVAGVAWSVRLLPLRVLGKCGGYTSDIIDATRWAAGIAVPNVPLNVNPAQVLNLSLGGPGACGVEEQRAIDDAFATGRVKAIVTSSGNDGGNSALLAPANCAGIMAVTATDRAGSRAPYANTGVNIALAAPGGTFSNSANDGILGLTNAGVTTPQADAFAFTIGTSQAAAHVSGVAALVLSANPNLTAAELRDLLRRTARAFPNATCDAAACGTGIVDAGAAVAAAVAAAPPPTQNQAAAPASSSDGGGGGGGCTTVRNGAPELALPLALLLAMFGIWRRRRR